MNNLNRRKKKYDNLRIIGIILMAIGGILVFSMSEGIISSSDSAFIFVIIGLLPGAGSYYYGRVKVKEISNEFKTTYVKKEIEKRIENSYFSPSSGIDKSVVLSSNLVRLKDVYKTEDLLTGTVNEVKFSSADIHIKERRRSNKRTYYVTTFKGRFYEFDFPKEFNSNVFLLQPGQFRPFLGFKKMKMESVEFNSEFKIYTNNEHDTFYLLTPPLMERLLKLDQKYSDKIGFSFFYNKLYIAIDSRRDAFDVMHFGDITQKHLDDAITEIENIIEFVEYLRLDNTLFKKKD